MVERLFIAVPWGCLRFVIVVFPDHTYLLFLIFEKKILLNEKEKKKRLFIKVTNGISCIGSNHVP